MVLINNVSKKFNDIQALKKIDLKIDDGQIFGLLGPNGAGKSTTINIISGLVKQDTGEVEIMGSSMRENEKEIKSNMGVCCQDIVVFEDLTVKENLEYFGHMYGLKGKQLKQNVVETLEFIELTNHQNRRPKKFSGGMRRRLNIGCAIIHKPKLIILDEPTVGIDVHSRNHILDDIKKLNKDGATIIYTSHYLEEVEQICDKVAIIDEGNVIVSGKIEDIIEQNAVSNKIFFEFSSPISCKTVKKIEDITDVISCESVDNMLTVSVKSASNCFNAVMDSLGEYSAGINSVSMKKGNLEDIFLSLTGKKLRE